jgi:single-strand DNA-binding protein
VSGLELFQQPGGREKNLVNIFSSSKQDVAIRRTVITHQMGDASQMTTRHKVSVFQPGHRDGTYQYMEKGSQIYVEGKVDYGEYLDKMM